ncbi:uncharacterized protein TNCV_5083311 [Trichonephila clavipes]|nr:uncharacterized protein TNCV_5083311 [Trichonephila clavipes]
MWVVVKLKRNELCVCVKLAEQIGLTVLRDAKMVDLKRLIEESDVFKEDYEFVKTVIKQVLEEIKIQKSKQNSQIELERLKSERAKAELKLAKLRNSANNKESFTTKLRIVVDASAHGRRVLEEVRLAKSDEDIKEPRKFFHLKVNEPTCLVWIQMLWHNLSLLGKKRVYLETHLMNS